MMIKSIFIYFIYFIFFCSCIAQESKALDSIFNQTKKIEILAFYDRDKWDQGDRFMEVSYIKNNSIEIKEKYLRNRILLNQDKILKLKSEFESCGDEDWYVEACYHPRHAIIFYNNENDIFGFIEICFSCSNTQSSKNLNFLTRCSLKLEKLLKEFGVNYFEETDEEIKEWNDKQEEKLRRFEEKMKEIEERDKIKQENKTNNE